MSRLLLMVLLVLPSVAGAQEDSERVQALLQKMHEANNTLNYEVTFVYQQNKQLSAMRIVHSFDGKQERERLTSLDHDGREVIRQDNKVTCILPDSGSVVVEKKRPATQFPPLFPVDISSLQDQYVFKLGPSSVVAGERCRQILIEPRDGLRYGHRLWVDEDTGLLLKTQLLDEKGRVLEQFMFTDIHFYDVIPPDKLEPEVDTGQYVWFEAQTDEETTSSEVNHDEWGFKQLPPGFSQSMQSYHRLADAEQAVDHVVISDGLASVSVFIEDASQSDGSFKGASHMGAVNAYGRKIGDYHITAVGEVPQATVKMISESVVYQP